MSTDQQLAKFITAMKQAGRNVGDYTTTPEGVVFKLEESARVFAEQHNKDLVQIDVGWLAKNRNQSN